MVVPKKKSEFEFERERGTASMCLTDACLGKGFNQQKCLKVFRVVI